MQSKEPDTHGLRKNLENNLRWAVGGDSHKKKKKAGNLWLLAREGRPFPHQLQNCGFRAGIVPWRASAKCLCEEEKVGDSCQTLLPVRMEIPTWWALTRMSQEACFLLGALWWVNLGWLPQEDRGQNRNKDFVGQDKDREITQELLSWVKQTWPEED